MQNPKTPKPLYNIGGRKHGSKGWFEEVGRRIEEYVDAGKLEHFAYNGGNVLYSALTVRDAALLNREAFALKNSNNRIKCNAQ